MKSFLKFKNRKLEKAFIAEYNNNSLHAMRLGFWLTIILYAVFGFLDSFMMPVSHMFMWFVRYAVVIPLTFAFFLLSFVRPARKYMQIIVSFNAIVMGFGIVSMIAAADPKEPGFNIYYAGLMLVIMGIASLFRLRFFYALFSSSLIIISYELTAVFIQRINDLNSPINSRMIFISNNFFFVSAIIIGLLAAYYLEYSTRVQFVQQVEINEKHGRLITLMNYMRTELELAKNIQTNLFPAVCPYLKDVKIHSMYKPMEELGGDFYDYVRFEEPNLLGIFISDVSGHGIPAALVTTMLKSLTITAGNNKFSPSGFLTYLNTHLAGQIGESFLTAIYLLYDSDTGELKISRAGHPYPMLIRSGEVTHIRSRGGAIGINHGINYEEITIKLNTGDKVLLYTDGLTEESDSSGVPFEEIYFSAILPGIVNLPVEELIETSYMRLIKHKGDDRLSDDICIVGIEIL